MHLTPAGLYFYYNFCYQQVLLRSFHSKPTERKVHAHARKCEKPFTCSLEQHLWTAGNILYFVLLATLI